MSPKRPSAARSSGAGADKGAPKAAAKKTSPTAKGAPRKKASDAAASAPPEEGKHVTLATTAPLVVDVPARAEEHVDIELGGRPLLQGDDDSGTQHGFISGPCDCCLTIWAGLGEAIEAGADQIVGVVLLPLSGALYYYFSLRESGAPPPGAHYEGGVAPPAPPAVPDWSRILVHLQSTFAQRYPILFLCVVLGSLVVIALLVLYEADLMRLYADMRMRARGYQPLDAVAADGSGEGEAAAADGAPKTKPVRLMRENTLRFELHKIVDGTEELELKMRVRGGADGGGADGGGTELRQLHEKRTVLQQALTAQAVAASPERRRVASNSSCWSAFMRSTLMVVFRRALNGARAGIIEPHARWMDDAPRCHASRPPYAGL